MSNGETMEEFINRKGPADPATGRCPELLENIQGNVLKGHGRDYAELIFFKWKGTPEEVRPALLDLVRGVTSAAQQLRWSRRYKALGIPGGLFVNFFLTAHGYKNLGFDDAQFRAAFPHNLASSFRLGMDHEPIRMHLRDPKVETWEEPYREPIFAMLLLADDDPKFLLRCAREAVEEIEKFGTVITVEHGAALRDERGEGVEHFGFEDGLSQPLFFTDDRTHDTTTSYWDAVAPLSLVLFKDRAVPDEAAYGSFLVYRKLEQNVRGFLARESELADMMHLEGKERDRVGAMVVGRFRDGTPLALSSRTNRNLGDADDFTYAGDPDGAKCPFHAHIRKVNPRSRDHLVDPDVNRIVRAPSRMVWNTAFRPRASRRRECRPPASGCSSCVSSASSRRSSI